MEAARQCECALELNAQPMRLDLNDIYCKMARDKGLKIAISTDSHSTNELSFMRLGIYQARRGWLEQENVLNSMKWNALEKLLKRK